eukprot:jgi/Mesen1/2929/ME000175S02082
MRRVGPLRSDGAAEAGAEAAAEATAATAASEAEVEAEAEDGGTGPRSWPQEDDERASTSSSSAAAAASPQAQHRSHGLRSSRSSSHAAAAPPAPPRPAPPRPPPAAAAAGAGVAEGDAPGGGGSSGGERQQGETEQGSEAAAAAAAAEPGRGQSGSDFSRGARWKSPQAASWTSSRGGGRGKGGEEQGGEGGGEDRRGVRLIPRKKNPEASQKPAPDEAGKHRTRGNATGGESTRGDGRSIYTRVYRNPLYVEKLVATITSELLSRAEYADLEQGRSRGRGQGWEGGSGERPGLETGGRGGNAREGSVVGLHVDNSVAALVSAVLDPHRSVLTRVELTTVIKKLGRQKAYGVAKGVFEWMARSKNNNVRPNGHAYTLMLGLLAEELVEEMEEAGCAPSLVTYNTLIHMFGKAGRMSDALKAFERIRQAGLSPDKVAYTALATGYCQAGSLDRAVEVLNRMVQHEGLQPDLVTYSQLMNVYKQAGMVDKVLGVMAQMRADGLAPNAVAYSALIQAYGRPVHACVQLDCVNPKLRA